MTESKRPSFDDQNVTERNPLATAHHAPDGDSRPVPPAVPSVPTIPDIPMTVEESALAAKSLFEPTLRRMTILVQTLIQVSENGDFALWASLGCLDQVLKGLDWTSVTPDKARRFYTLIQIALSNYAMKLDAYVSSLGTLTADAVLPPLPEWTTDDTLKMYDLVDTTYDTSAKGGA